MELQGGSRPVVGWRSRRHIMLAEGLLFTRVEQALAAKPNPGWAAKTAGKSAFLEQGLLNR